MKTHSTFDYIRAVIKFIIAIPLIILNLPGYILYKTKELFFENKKIFKELVIKLEKTDKKEMVDLDIKFIFGLDIIEHNIFFCSLGTIISKLFKYFIYGWCRFFEMTPKIFIPRNFVAINLKYIQKHRTVGGRKGICPRPIYSGD